jgi:hypothetical protein
MTSGEFVAAMEEAIASYEMSMSRLRFLHGRGTSPSEVRRSIPARISKIEALVDSAYQRRNAVLRRAAS